MYSPSSFPISKAHSSINVSLSQVITSSSSLPAFIRYTLRRSDDLLRIFACISADNASIFTNSQSTVVKKEPDTCCVVSNHATKEENSTQNKVRLRST